MNKLPLFILVTLSFMQVPNCFDTACHAAKQPLWPMGPCCRTPPRASAIGAAAQASRKRAKEIKRSKSCKSIFDEANKKGRFSRCAKRESSHSFGLVDWKGTRRRERERSAACRRPMHRALERLCSVYSARSFFMAGIMRLTTHQAMTATAITMMTIFTMSEKPSTC